MTRNHRFAFVLAALLLAACGRSGNGNGNDGGGNGSWWSHFSLGTGVLRVQTGGVQYGGAAEQVKGSDRLANQWRPIADIRSVVVDGPMDVVLRQDGDEGVTVHADDNIVPLIATDLGADGVLRIGVRPHAAFRMAHPVGITLFVPRLQSIVMGTGGINCAEFEGDRLHVELRGPGSARFDEIRAKELSVRLAGAGGISVAGSVPEQNFEIDGSGSVDAGDLAGQNVTVRIAGRGGATLWAIETLKADITGTGTVHYRGMATVTRTGVGSGTVRRQPQ